MNNILKIPAIAATILFLDTSIMYGLAQPRTEEINNIARNTENEKGVKQLIEKAISKAKKKHILQKDSTENGLLERSTKTLSLPPIDYTNNHPIIPSKGTIKMLALLIDFPDEPHNSAFTNEHINTRLFGQGDPNNREFDSLSKYYYRSSYGQLNVIGNTLGWYTANNNRSIIDLDNNTSRENLIKEAIGYYKNQGHDFSQYGVNGYMHIMVIYSGVYGGTDSGEYTVRFLDESYNIDGNKISRYTMDSQWDARSEFINLTDPSFYPKNVIHEFGHLLGLPDYYDLVKSVGLQGGVGGRDVMGGRTRGDHNCFSKYLLDWIDPIIISSGTQTVTLNPSGTSKDAILIMPGITSSDIFSEYFMIQNRSKVGNDNVGELEFGSDMFSNGLLIWLLMQHWMLETSLFGIIIQQPPENY